MVQLTEEQKKHWQRLIDTTDEEGLDQAIRHYSNWEEIEDPIFHGLRRTAVEAMSLITTYIEIIAKTNDIKPFNQ
jgi:hypothetical protein